MTDLCFDAALLGRFGGRMLEWALCPPSTGFVEVIADGPYRERLRASNELPIPPGLTLFVEAPAEPIDANRFHRCFQAEAQLVGGLFDDDRCVEHVSLGPGVSALADATHLSQVLRSLDSCFDIRGFRGTGRAANLLARLATGQCLDGLAAVRVDRLMLLDDGIGSAAVSLDRAVHDAQRAGIRSVSVHLRYGHPDQTPTELARRLDALLHENPDTVQLAPSVDSTRPPAEPGLSGNAWTAYETTVRRLTRAGYQHLGLDRFVRSEHELLEARRTGELTYGFMGYDRAPPTDVVALGVGSRGIVQGLCTRNQTHIDGYCAQLDAGRLPIACTLDTGPQHRLRAAIVEQLVCHRRLDLAQLNTVDSETAAEQLSAEFVALEPLANAGLIRIGGTGIEVTDRGELMLAAIAGVFAPWRRGEYLQRPSD